MQAVDFAGATPPLSLLEKYLLKHGWEVRDEYDPSVGRTRTVASQPDAGRTFAYPHPKQLCPGADRQAEARQALTGLAELLGMETDALAVEIGGALEILPPGYDCLACGACCSLRDAFQGTVSPEEVEMWRRAGREDILRWVSLREHGGYSSYHIWVQPKTGRYLKKCPWLRKVPGEERRLCSIHEIKPFKCRAFPLNRRQAERIRCPGLRDDDL